MASIAYITDKHMIEYHRLNGSHRINFWKPSSMKKIVNFQKGDYLFFLGKGTERGIDREKGIIGYGKLEKSHDLTFQQMWNTYDTLNGYPTKEELESAIIKIMKNHALPKIINCMLLNDVVFFQSPIYLSELHINISSRVESFIYLDKDDLLNTSKVLDLADQIGFDSWSSLFQDYHDDTFLIDAKVNYVQNVYETLKVNFYSKHEEKRITKYIQQSFQFEYSKKLIQKKNEIFVINKDNIEIYIPCLVNIQDFMIKFHYSIAHYQLYKYHIKKGPYANSIVVYLLFNQEIGTTIQEYLDALDIAYKEKLVKQD